MTPHKKKQSKKKFYKTSQCIGNCYNKMKCYNIIYNYDCVKEKIANLTLENVEPERLTIMSQLALSNLVLVQSCIKDDTVPPAGLYLYYPEFTVALRYELINVDCENSSTNV